MPTVLLRRTGLATPATASVQRLQVLWLAWFLCLLFHTDLGLMPLFHGISPEIESQVPPDRLPLVFWSMLLYFLLPLLAWLLNGYALSAGTRALVGRWRRWGWCQLVLGLVYTLTNIVHLVVDVLIPDSRGDQVVLMVVMVVIGLLINRESLRWCRAR